MKLRCLSDRFSRMPFVRIVIPFAAGIAAAEWGTLPLWFLAGAFVCTGILSLLLRSGVCTAAMLLAAGFGSAQLRVREPAVPIGVPTLFEVVVDGLPADRGRYAAAEGRVTAWRDPATGRWAAAADGILLRADSTVSLAGGARLRMRGTIRPLRGGSEGYRRLMARRGFVGTLFLSERMLLERLPSPVRTLHLRAARRMEALGVPGAAGAAVRAMTVGDRSGIAPAQRAVYARSGLAHLLALSGLHAGIVFLMVNASLWWLPLLRYGHIVRHVLALVAVWLFAAAAGFPPSAVRAAMMCSCLQLALATGSEYSGLNALAAAAFGMLLWQPAWIGDPGFLLSFAAVGAILAWAVPLCRRLRTRSRWVNAVTGAFVVGAVATAATAPLVAHLFGIVPLAGIVATPIAVLPAAAILFAGAVWLVSPVDALAPALRFVAGEAAGALDAVARFAADLPAGILECSLSAGQTAVCYLFFAIATAVAWCAEPKKNVHLPV